MIQEKELIANLAARTKDGCLVWTTDRLKSKILFQSGILYHCRSQHAPALQISIRRFGLLHRFELFVDTECVCTDQSLLKPLFDLIHSFYVRVDHKKIHRINLLEQAIQVVRNVDLVPN